MGSANVRGLTEERAEVLRERLPWDVLCLQECKSPVEKIPVEAFQAL